MALFKNLIRFPNIYLWKRTKRFSSSRNILKLSERGMYQDMFPNTAA